MTSHSVARYVCSLAPLTPLTRSAALSLLTPFTGSLTHFANSLVGQLKFMKICSRWKGVEQKESYLLSSVEIRPQWDLVACTQFIFLKQLILFLTRGWPDLPLISSKKNLDDYVTERSALLLSAFVLVMTHGWQRIRRGMVFQSWRKQR